jgi:hypothetical protein
MLVRIPACPSLFELVAPGIISSGCNCGVASIFFEVDGSTMYTETLLYLNNNIKIKIVNNYLPLSLFELVEFISR